MEKDSIFKSFPHIIKLDPACAKTVRNFSLHHFK